MADIIKVYTAEQLYTMYRNKLLADNVGLTDFNPGSKIRSLIESNSEFVSSISMDFKEALYRAIKIALYEGFGFEKTAAVEAIGYLRLYRKPAFWVKYTGAGTSALITSNSTLISATVTGAPADAFSFAYASYPTLTDVVTAIDNLSNWSATLVLGGTIDSTTIYQYTDQEVIDETNYLYADGRDIMLNTDTAITVPAGFSVSINQQSFITSAEVTIPAGDSGLAILSEATIAGEDGNILAGAIDTLNGQGYINSSIDGIEYAINDSAFSGGSDAETDDERVTRFKETVNALNAGTKDGIIVAIKAITGVRSVGMRTSYPFNGTNTIIVDDGTGTISSTLLASVEKVLYGDPDDLINYPGKNAEGIGYNIIAPVIQAIDVTATVYRYPAVNVDLDEIETDVQTAIEQYINTRALGEDVILSEIIRVAKNSNAAIYDITITLPAANVSIDETNFAKTGSGTGASVTITTEIASSI